jgi:hypothetical protein
MKPFKNAQTKNTGIAIEALESPNNSIVSDHRIAGQSEAKMHNCGVLKHPKWSLVKIMRGSS